MFFIGAFFCLFDRECGVGKNLEQELLEHFETLQAEYGALTVRELCEKYEHEATSVVSCYVVHLQITDHIQQCHGEKIHSKQDGADDETNH